MLAEQKKRGQMTRQEAGRKGGEKVARERGAEFYRKIGKKGGRKSRRSEVQNSTGKLAEKAEKAEETEVAILELKSQLARI